MLSFEGLLSVGCRLLLAGPRIPEDSGAHAVAAGAMDRRSPVHVAEQLHAAIPGAELAIIPEAGHLSNMEQPEVFNVHVSRFCLSQDTE